MENFAISTLESWDGNRSLKQHIFVETNIHIRKHEYLDYLGNKSLCGKMYCMGEDETPMELQEMANEPLNKKTICKTCERIALKKGLIIE